MKKQLYTLLGIFLFLAIGMHFSEWTSHPIEHLMALPHAGAFGVGATHPIVFTVIVYVLFTIILWLGSMIKKLF